MNFERINLFIEVIRQGSFAAVSTTRDLDPSVVSRSIAALEQELGARLFHRTTRRLSPTEAGLAFFNLIEPLMEEFERARNVVFEEKNSPTGILRITTTVSFGLMFMIQFITKFQTLYPYLTIEFIMTDSVLNLVENRIDVAVRFGHLEDSSFIANKLTPTQYVACASSAYFKKNGTPEKPTDLTHHNCLQFLISGFADNWKFRNRKTAKEERIPIKGNLKISNALGLKDSALLGAGIVLLPKVLVGKELEKGSLVSIFNNYDITATDFDANVWVLYPSKEFLPTKIKLFVDFLKTEFAKVKYT